MALNLEGFYTPEQKIEGLSQAGEKNEKKAYRDQQLQEQRNAKRAATGKFLTDYLGPKDRLTGTVYDPEIVRQLNDVLVEGADLASKGANTSDILMALGPKVGKINEYSQKAKLVNKQITDSAAKLKSYKGYNADAIIEEARKMAFFDDKGQLKDIREVDPQKDWVTEVVTQRPELVTSGAGLDEFVGKVPMKEYGSEVQTMYAGKKRNVKYDAKSPFYMGVATDKEGNAVADKSGNPVGLEVMGDEIVDDKGHPIVSPEGKPYKALNKGAFDAIMLHNPDVADFIRGRTRQKFQTEGGEIPKEGSPQWDLMSRRLLRDELQTRDRSFFKPKDLQTTSGLATRIELGIPFGSGKGSGSADPIDLTGYPKEQGGKNITDLMQGIKVTGLPNGQSLLAEKVVFNKAKKEVTFKEYTSRDDSGKMVGGQTKTVSLKKFLQDIKSNNPNTDMKFLEGLWNAVGSDEGETKGKEPNAAPKGSNPFSYGNIGGAQQQKTYSLKGKQYPYSAIEAAAKKSGMSIEAYIKKAGLK